MRRAGRPGALGRLLLLCHQAAAQAWIGDTGKRGDTPLPQHQPGSRGEPVDYASILSGTRSRIDYGTGSLLPFVGRPWGMNNWALQTNNYQGSVASPLSSWWYHPEDRELYGIRCTHQASPWIYDYGEFLLTPAVGGLKPQWPDKASKYNRTAATMKTYLLNTTWQSYCSAPEHKGGCLSAALTATERAALMHVRFPPHNPQSGWDQTRHLRLLVGRHDAASTDNVTVDAQAGVIKGYTRANSGGVPSGQTPAPAPMLTAQTHRTMTDLASCNDTMHVSYTLNFNESPDWSEKISVVGVSDAAAACAAACCGSARCVAWILDLDDAKAPQCIIGSAASLTSDSGGSHVVGWRGSYTPTINDVKFAHYFYLEFDSPIVSHSSGAVDDDHMYQNGLEAVVSFAPTVPHLNVRIGTSFISVEQAQKNLQR
jgi:putative alpha-1,2-mannosidase